MGIVHRVSKSRTWLKRLNIHSWPLELSLRKTLVQLFETP